MNRHLLFWNVEKWQPQEERLGDDSAEPGDPGPRSPCTHKVVTPAHPPTAQAVEIEPEHLLGGGQHAVSLFYFLLQQLSNGYYHSHFTEEGVETQRD